MEYRRRPSCESCGFVEIGEEEITVINFLDMYWRNIIRRTQSGIVFNTSAIKDLSNASENDFRLLVKFVNIFVTNYINSMENITNRYESNQEGETVH